MFNCKWFLWWIIICCSKQINFKILSFRVLNSNLRFVWVDYTNIISHQMVDIKINTSCDGFKIAIKFFEIYEHAKFQGKNEIVCSLLHIQVDIVWNQLYVIIIFDILLFSSYGETCVECYNTFQKEKNWDIFWWNLHETA